MKNIFRISIVLMIFLSGVALVPAMGLPTYGFSWQRYAGVYGQTSMDINHPSGAPGSFFTIIGMNFSPEESVSVYANGVLLGSLDTSESGDLLFILDTAGADEGYYIIEVSGSESAQIKVLLDSDAPLQVQEDEGTLFSLSANGVAPVELIFMPVIEQ